MSVTISLFNPSSSPFSGSVGHEYPIYFQAPSLGFAPPTPASPQSIIFDLDSVPPGLAGIDRIKFSVLAEPASNAGGFSLTSVTPTGPYFGSIDDTTTQPNPGPIDDYFFSGSQTGTYQIELIVSGTYDAGGSFNDTFLFVIDLITNTAPTAVATNDSGYPSIIRAPTTPVELDGSSSFDVPVGPLLYNWTISAAPGGSTATITDSTNPIAEIVPDVGGLYTIQLEVTDQPPDIVIPLSDSTTTQVSASVAPTPDIDSPANLAKYEKGDTVSIDGTTTTDVDNAFSDLTFGFSLTEQPIGSTSTINENTPSAGFANFTTDEPGLYTAEMSVEDQAPGTYSTTVSIAAGPFSISSSFASPNYPTVVFQDFWQGGTSFNHPGLTSLTNSRYELGGTADIANMIYADVPRDTDTTLRGLYGNTLHLMWKEGDSLTETAPNEYELFSDSRPARNPTGFGDIKNNQIIVPFPSQSSDTSTSVGITRRNNPDIPKSSLSPYILFPEDSLVLGIDVGISCIPLSGTNASGPEDSTFPAGASTSVNGIPVGPQNTFGFAPYSSLGEAMTGSFMFIQAGKAKLTLFGSMVKEGKQYFESYNQPFETVEISEALHFDNPVVDEYEISTRAEFAGSNQEEKVAGRYGIAAWDNEFDGGISLDRQIVGALSLGTLGTTGSLQRFDVLLSDDEILTDTGRKNPFRFRYNRYGQVRDMLEGGLNTRFLDLREKKTGLRSPSVSVKFVSGCNQTDPLNTYSQDLSTYSTGSGPFVDDGVATFRTDDPDVTLDEYLEIT